MNRINEIIAGLSFLGVLSATGLRRDWQAAAGYLCCTRAVPAGGTRHLCTQGITSMKKPLTGGQSQSTAKTNITLT